MPEIIPQISPQAAYDELAKHYDAVSSTPDYHRWMQLFDDLLREYEVRGPLLLDLGCGTGNSSVELKKQGYQVTGIDISPEMIKVAGNKEEMAGIEFRVGELTALPCPSGSFDAATAAGEPFHYLLEESTLTSAFSEVKRVLAPQGLLVAEMNTTMAFRVSAEGPGVRRAKGSFVCFSPSSSTPFSPGGLLDLEADSFVEQSDGAWEHLSTRHRTRHFTHEQILQCLKESGLEFVAARGFHGSGLAQDLDEEHHIKALYVARRAASEG
ncbi:class I SAM-dependent DNA methyltransferase [Nocardiopsis alkaliphila]|uniref:class I SAM-dependent DNA methyltransferase n=1 Tax=Nocardiopsis alkaliphila TaxID=225762 RepID=UPI00037194C7|nr:class I SAM-dependent methyltransferase [Nocardiopsis alkaliphila]